MTQKQDITNEEEQIYQELLNENWNNGDMNSLAILGRFSRELIRRIK